MTLRDCLYAGFRYAGRRFKRESWGSGHWIGFNENGTLYEVTAAAPQPVAAKLGVADTYATDWMMG